MNYTSFHSDVNLGTFDPNFISTFRVRTWAKYNISCDQIKMEIYDWKNNTQSDPSFFTHKWDTVDPLMCEFDPLKDPIYQEFIK